jgi:prepilin-type N-terminal cleavage/methylation domain-containing protein
MRIFRDKKGFTLIELLAVIVVLAAVMLMAVNSVLPLIGEARTGAFASSANQTIDSVSTVILTDELRGNSNVECYSVRYLVEKGFLSKIESANNDKTTGFDGIVVIDKGTSNSGSYKYSIYMVDYSSGYYYAGSGLAAGVIKGEEVSTYEISKPFYSTCASYAEANNLEWIANTNYHD